MYRTVTRFDNVQDGRAGIYNVQSGDQKGDVHSGGSGGYLLGNVQNGRPETTCSSQNPVA